MKHGKCQQCRADAVCFQHINVYVIFLVFFSYVVVKTRCTSIFVQPFDITTSTILLTFYVRFRKVSQWGIGSCRRVLTTFVYRLCFVICVRVVFFFLRYEKGLFIIS